MAVGGRRVVDVVIKGQHEGALWYGTVQYLYRGGGAYTGDKIV